MKKTLYITGIILWSAFAFLACEKVDVDNEKPVITVMKPSVDEAVTPGSAVHFEVLFSDNEALASYKVDIHGAFDDHEHSAAAAGTGNVVVATDIGTELSGIDMRAVTGNGTELLGAVTRTATDSVAFEKTWRESDFIALGETPIAGKEQARVAHQHIVIPASINGMPLREGHYHFIVYCTDQAGQESFVAQEIFVSY